MRGDPVGNLQSLVVTSILHTGSRVALFHMHMHTLTGKLYRSIENKRGASQAVNMPPAQESIGAVFCEICADGAVVKGSGL